MSASLVGSEMCIRDRARGTTRGRARSRGPCARWDSQREGESPEGVGRRAVSYTHLTLPTICSV
eukprot:3484548-Alexandrium_andersonii.AAC.1